MKKLLHLFTSILLFGCSSSDDSSAEGSETNNSELSKYIVECSGYVKFDSNNSSFLNFLISKGYDLNNDSKISCEEASKITKLDLGNSGAVSNLGGIESFQNLQTITGYVLLRDSNINPNANILNLYNNSNLQEINFNVRAKSNAITTMQTIILPKSSKLTKLDCSLARIKNILNLNTQTNLESIDFQNSGVIGVIDLSGSTQLKTINLSKNAITEIKFPKTPVISLKEINLGGSPIDGVNDNNNSLTSINLEMLPNLESLALSYNKLTSVDISKNPKLTLLDITFNKILKIDLTNNKEIIHLKVSSTLISLLNLKELANLRSLYCTNTLIENIDLSNNKLIYYIQLENNQLKTLNLKNGRNTFINSMSATKNKINCITVDNGFTPDPKKWVKDANTKYCN
ncbi:hypothetical protein [Flavobacterium sp. 1355]|uniref:hypothetical protein n=1 Tax=Flavobacterium sp. 1355 TaxID=2806571 RepID=UPI001AE6F1B0|nr:hypothetical protein [Flavobacterium sp. 1355]MBP1222902.1 hypothetical protein [Flavobacterium sp. 1355]